MAPWSRSGSSFSARAKRRVSTSRIMRVIVAAGWFIGMPGRRDGADVELAVGVLHAARSGPATIIAPIALVPEMWLLS